MPDQALAILTHDMGQRITPVFLLHHIDEQESRHFTRVAQVARKLAETLITAAKHMDRLDGPTVPLVNRQMLSVEIEDASGRPAKS